MGWDIDLGYGILLSTCYGIVVTENAALWDAPPQVFKSHLGQARELLEYVKDLEFALCCPGNGDRSPQDVYNEAATLKENIFAPIILNIFSESCRRKEYQCSTRQQGKPSLQLKAGYVYLLKGGNYHKIGLSKDTDRRMEEILPKLPFETELVCTIATEDMYGLESRLHEQFADKRANGEWFKLNEADVEYIRRLAE